MFARGLIVLAAVLACMFAALGLLSDARTVQPPEKSPIEGYRTWYRVNAEPAVMDAYVSSLCRNDVRTAPESPHTMRYITVFVNDIGKPAMISKAARTFPVGTIIVKEKFKSFRDERPELLTIMIKRENGFAPKVGDWEFMTASSEARVNRKGDISHCVYCHQSMPNSDFTFKSYLADEQ